MTLVTNILLCALGVLFIWAAFFATGIAGAFSGGPYRPITKAGRVIIFVTGVALLGSGVRQLLH